MSRRESVEKFIMNYLQEHRFVDVLDENFHDAFALRFGGTRKTKTVGAQPVGAAMVWLKRLSDEGILERSIVGVNSMEGGVGWPKWVYLYELKKGDKQ